MNKTINAKTKIRFDKLRQNCQAFYRASSILWADDDVEHSIENRMPIIVNTAFTCELAFKAILVKCGQGFHKGHKLYELFYDLQPELQDCVLSELKLFYPTQTEEWLVDEIKLMSNIYQKERYFDEYTTVIDVTFCRNFMEVVVFIEQKLCGLVKMENVTNKVQIDENQIDSDINKAMSNMITEAEKSLEKKIKSKKTKVETA